MDSALPAPNTATQISPDKLPGFDTESWLGDARFYELSTPLNGYAHVIVSTVQANADGPADAIVVPATPFGAVLDWTILPGSAEGITDHAAALRAAGYEIAEEVNN